jgi:PKD repeat protein
MKTIFLNVLFLLIVVMGGYSDSFGQNLKSSYRSSFKKDIKFEQKPVTNTHENIAEQRSFRLFKNPNGYLPNGKKDAIDTLNYPLEGTYSIYSANNGGYVTGNNGYGDLAKANKFVISEACKITGILFDFYYASGGPADIDIVVWDNTGEFNAPGNIIGGTTIPLSSIQNDIANNQTTYIAFDEPLIATTTFFAGVNLPTSAGDTLVIWSNTDGDTDPGIAWEKHASGNWYPMFQNVNSWGRNLAMAIFPIVDFGPLPLMADFMASTTQIQPGGSILFTDLSTGNPTSRTWTFEGGDPATSGEPNLAVVYNEVGTYDVTLIVEKDTIQDTKTIEDYITVAETSIEVDTLNFPLNGTYARYLTPENAYVAGNNEYGDLAKANYFDIADSYYITGILYEFDTAIGGGPSIEMVIWDSDGANNNPGTKIAFRSYLLDNIIADVAAGNFTFVPFDPPVLVNDPFYAGFMLPTTPGDTLAIWSNLDGDAGPGIAWELWSTNEWFPFSDTWPLDVALAIFPIVQNTLDIDEYSNPDRLNIFPNPSNGYVTIELEGPHKEDMQLEIVDVSGRIILERSYVDKEIPVSIDISDLPDGAYMVRIVGGQQIYSQKIIKY